MLCWAERPFFLVEQVPPASSGSALTRELGGQEVPERLVLTRGSGELRAPAGGEGWWSMGPGWQNHLSRHGTALNRPDRSQMPTLPPGSLHQGRGPMPIVSRREVSFPKQRNPDII